MEDHLKICLLQELESQFKHVGCDEKFIRDNKEEHMKKMTQSHLVMMITAFTKMEVAYHMNLEEQERRFEEQERRFKEQERRLTEQERRFTEQGRSYKEHKRELEEKLVAQQEVLLNLLKESEETKATIEKLAKVGSANFKFTLKNFSQERARNNMNWSHVHSRGWLQVLHKHRHHFYTTE